VLSSRPASDYLPLRMVNRTLMEVLLFIAEMGSVMDQTKSGSRIVVITGIASTTKKTVYRKPPRQQPPTCRIVLFRNSELVNGKPSR
jgi:hypothetical protein